MTSCAQGRPGQRDSIQRPWVPRALSLLVPTNLLCASVAKDQLETTFPGRCGDQYRRRSSSIRSSEVLLMKPCGPHTALWRLMAATNNFSIELYVKLELQRGIE